MSLETMTNLGTYTVGAGGIASYTFSNIPQTYTDLILKASARVSGSQAYAEAELRLQFNSDTTSANYKYMQHWGLGSGSVGSNTGSNFFFGNIEGGGMTATVFSTSEICIPNYSGNSFKTTIWSSTEESSTVNATIVNGLTKWSNTAPITSIKISSDTNSFVQYSTFTLYGVKAQRTAVGNSIKATGGAIAFDGTYVTHTFNTTDVFTPTTNLLVDYLVVAGGGGAGGGGSVGWTGGGGGAGGLKTSTAFSCAATGLTVTIGAGGTGGVYDVNGLGPVGTVGSNSVFSSITSTGGGYGGFGSNNTISVGGAGGSGGGAGSSAGTVQSGGAASPAGQGNAGGPSATANVSGGGGGAGSAGTASSSNGAGSGLSNSYSGSAVTYSTGGATTGGTAGTANTGNGGKSAGSAAGGNGGSGIVIIRYKG